jgi:hypothetical protein
VNKGKYNLSGMGCYISTGNNPPSGKYSFMTMNYDVHLRENPPPGFPGSEFACFRNWHVVDLEKR